MKGYAYIHIYIYIYIYFFFAFSMNTYYPTVTEWGQYPKWNHPKPPTASSHHESLRANIADATSNRMFQGRC